MMRSRRPGAVCLAQRGDQRLARAAQGAGAAKAGAAGGEAHDTLREAQRERMGLTIDVMPQRVASAQARYCCCAAREVYARAGGLCSAAAAHASCAWVGGESVGAQQARGRPAARAVAAGGRQLVVVGDVVFCDGQPAWDGSARLRVSARPTSSPMMDDPPLHERTTRCAPAAGKPPSAHHLQARGALTHPKARQPARPRRRRQRSTSHFWSTGHILRRRMVAGAAGTSPATVPCPGCVPLLIFPGCSICRSSPCRAHSFARKRRRLDGGAAQRPAAMIRECVSRAARKHCGNYFFSFPGGRAARYIVCSDSGGLSHACSELERRQFQTAAPRRLLEKETPPRTAHAEHHLSDACRHFPWVSSINTEAHRRRRCARALTEVDPSPLFLRAAQPFLHFPTSARPEARERLHAGTEPVVYGLNGHWLAGWLVSRSGARAPVARRPGQPLIPAPISTRLLQTPTIPSSLRLVLERREGGGAQAPPSSLRRFGCPATGRLGPCHPGRCSACRRVQGSGWI